MPNKIRGHLEVRRGGAFSHGGNYPKSSKSLDDFRIETHGDLGYKYLHFRKPPCMNRVSDHIKVGVSETSERDQIGLILGR